MVDAMLVEMAMVTMATNEASNFVLYMQIPYKIKHLVLYTKIQCCIVFENVTNVF